MLLRWIKVESGYKLHILLEICWQEKRTFGGSCQKFFKTFGRLWDLSILNKWNNKFLNQYLRDITPPLPPPPHKKRPLYRVESWTVFSHKFVNNQYYYSMRSCAGKIWQLICMVSCKTAKWGKKKLVWRMTHYQGGTYQSFIREGSHLGPTPYPFIYHFWQTRCLFHIPSIDNWYPFHIL